MRTVMKYLSTLKSVSGSKSNEKEFIWLCSCLFSLSYFRTEFVVDLHQQKEKSRLFHPQLLISTGKCNAALQ